MRAAASPPISFPCRLYEDRDRTAPNQGLFGMAGFFLNLLGHLHALGRLPSDIAFAVGTFRMSFTQHHWVAPVPAS